MGLHGGESQRLADSGEWRSAAPDGLPTARARGPHRPTDSSCVALRDSAVANTTVSTPLLQKSVAMKANEAMVRAGSEPYTIGSSTQTLCESTASKLGFWR